LELNCHLSISLPTFDLNKVSAALANFSSDNFLWNPFLCQYLFLNHTSGNGLKMISSCGIVTIAKSISILCRNRKQDSLILNRLYPGEVQALLFCTHFPGKDVFDRVKPWVSEIIDNIDGASVDLLVSLVDSLDEASLNREKKESELRQNYKSAGEEFASAPNDQFHFAYLPASRLRDSVCLFLPSTPNPSVVSKVISLAAHPYLSSSSYPRSLSNLKLFLGRLDLSLERCGEIMSCDPALGSYLSTLMDNESMTSRRCAAGVLLLLFHSVGGPMRDLAVSELSKMITTFLQADEIATFTDDEIAVFLNPQLLVARVSKQISLDDVKITNADRKKSSARGTRRGQFGADFVEDEEWAEQVKKDKAKKLQEAKMESSPEMEEAKAKTAQILARVEAANKSSSRVVELIVFLATSPIGKNADSAQTLLSRTCHLIIPQLMILIQYPLLAGKVNDCLDRVVCALVDDEMSVFSQTIANSLRVTGGIVNQLKVKGVSEDSLFDQALTLSGPIVRTIKELHVLASRSNYSISPKSFHVLFPLFKGILSLKAILPGCEYAFLIFDKFWGDVSSDPTSRPLLRYIIETCLVVLSRYRIVPSPDKMLIRVISSNTLSPMEWSPVLSPLGLLHSESSIRKVCLLAILSSQELDVCGPIHRNPLMVSRLWVACHDSNEEIKALALQTWEKSEMNLSAAFMTSLCPLLSFQEPHVALAAARSIAGGILKYPHLARESVETLVQIFLESLPEPETPTPSSDVHSFAKILPLRTAKKQEDTKVSIRVAVAGSFEAFGSMMAFDKQAASTEELVKCLSDSPSLTLISVRYPRVPIGAWRHRLSSSRSRSDGDCWKNSPR
jgi:hypothetical protein